MNSALAYYLIGAVFFTGYSVGIVVADGKETIDVDPVNEPWTVAVASILFGLIWPVFLAWKAARLWNGPRSGE